jgi:hypothetical protein
MLLLAGCAATGPISTPAPLTPRSITVSIPTLPIDITSIPTTPTIEPCAYVEAYQSLRELTAQIDQAVKQIQPDASGGARAYGENCVYASTGQATFSAMETDFYFNIPVKDLKDNNELGTWIINTMKIIEALPASSIAGPQAGFVEFTFKTKDDQKKLSVQIGNYESLPANIDANEIIPTLFPSP